MGKGEQRVKRIGRETRSREETEKNKVQRRRVKGEPADSTRAVSSPRTNYNITTEFRLMSL